MKITLRMLEEKGASPEGIKWFKKNFGKETDHTKIIKKLEEEKTTTNWMGWLYCNFKLSGRYQEWYENGNKYAERNYKDGKRHGRCKLWYDNGKKSFDCTFKDGEEV